MREFIKTELNLPELENVDIERAHRMKSRDENTCIIVKFTKYKDRDQILSRARRTLGNTRYSGRGAERRDGGSTRAPERASPLASEQASATDDVA